MSRRASHLITLDDDPLWYKSGIIYQLHVRAFFDSNGDGIGDFPGLTQKLDYLQDLGVTALWLLPFYPSPLKDDGYDIAEYTSVHPNYGTLADFKLFLKEAHHRGLRVITELVINHTSDQHPWFQRSRTAKAGSRARDFYVWTNDPTRYAQTRIIFKDFETSNWTWDPVAGAYYWHRFYHHQPDLNFDNPEVHKAIARVLDFWMEMGVDGLRLDAVPYLYEREGTSCENLPETHQYLKSLRAHVDGKFKNRMLLAEANQWPDETRPYFGEGDECHVAFHFPLMPRLFMSLAMEDRFPIIDIMNQTPEIPENCQWALFLRNHDELTLEMVTDEDRDYMYRAYAQDRQARINLGIRRRLAPLMGNHRRRIELMNALLFSFPGTPIIYYGDEIGMGDNIYLGDRNGVRTPMQWSPDRNAGFSRTNPQRLYFPIVIDPEYHYEATNVESQQNNPHSLLWWMKRLIDQRKRSLAFGRGTLEFLHPDNRKVLALVRSFEQEAILLVANLSRFSQSAELDLSAYEGLVPMEVFGHTPFPVITTRPYNVTLGPHGFYWFSLERPREEGAAEAVRREQKLPSITANSWNELLGGRQQQRIADAIGAYVRQRRWFGAKARDVKSFTIDDALPLPGTEARLVILRVDYREGTSDRYLLPLGVEWSPDVSKAEERLRSCVIARLRGASSEGVLYEAVTDRAFANALLAAIASRKPIRADGAELLPLRTTAGRSLTRADLGEPSVLKAEQSNTAITYGDQLFLKLFRRLEPGLNTDVEVSRFLTEKTAFRNLPLLHGALEYRRGNQEPMTLAMVQAFTRATSDAWTYSLDAIGRYFERMASGNKPALPPMPRNWVAASREETPREIVDVIGTYLADVELLGTRTGELHVALASRPDDPDFAPEPFTPHYQRGIYQSMRGQASTALQLLRRRVRELQGPAAEDAVHVLTREPEIQERFKELLQTNVTAKRLRIHGDYHLGQVLHTGKDFVIIDFEGEPARPVSERRIKRSPLRDVAGMLRSFHYAPYAVLFGQAAGVSVRSDDATALDPAARLWQNWVSVAFLRAYLTAGAAGGFLPADDAELSMLLHAYLLEKALYELAYELNNRPAWVSIPLHGILQLLGPA